MLLHRIDVLIFINQHVSQSLLDASPDVCKAFEQPHAEEQQLIEIQQVTFSQLSLIGFGNFRQARVVRRRIDVGPSIAECGHVMEHPLDGGSSVRLPQSPQGPLHHRHLSTPISHAEVPRQIEPMPLRSQQLETKAMESPQTYLARLRPDKPFQSLTHFSRSPRGKGHGQEFLGCDVSLGQQVRETNRQRFGLAGTGPRNHEHRTITGQHGFPLPVVKALEQQVGLDVHGRLTLQRDCTCSLIR